MKPIRTTNQGMPVYAAKCGHEFSDPMPGMRPSKVDAIQRVLNHEAFSVTERPCPGDPYASNNLVQYLATRDA